MVKRLGWALLAGALVAVLPEVLGPGPTADLAVGDKLASGSIWGALALIYLGGVLTALTPCVYPLIPITVSIFGARGAQSRTRAVALTTSYNLGIAAMFTALGIGAALSGKAFGSALGNPVIVLVLAVLLTALAISMFGGFDLNLPPALAQRLNSVGGAGYGGAFAMGLVAGIVAAPCTGPVLSGVLLFVAKTQNVPLGAALLFVYALGIGLPFFLIGALSLQLPKSGAWMEAVKSVFGIALLTLAVGYIRDAFPLVRELLSLKALSYGALFAATLVVLGIGIGAIHHSFHAPKTEVSLKVAGVALVVVGLLLRTGAFIGVAEANKPLEWASQETSALARGVELKKPVLIDFYADWCAACKELDKLVYTHPSFQQEAQRFVLSKIDGTNDEDPALEKLYKKYGVQGLPTVIFIDANGKVREDLTVTGFLEADKFVELMKKVQ